MFGLLDPLLAPPGGRLVVDAAITLLPGTLPIFEHQFTGVVGVWCD